MPLSHLFVSKHRKVEFELNILIQDLTNVPLVSGFFLVKWKIKNADQTNGTTARSPIRDHTIFWGESISTTSELVISKKQGHVLGPCEFKLEVYQENARELIPIGNLVINLSEYAESGLTTRRYLLDDCKFNSTIKLAIRMNRLSDTDIHFNVPPLKKQQVFTDIPSMITERQDKSIVFDELSLPASLSSHNIAPCTSPEVPYLNHTPIKHSQSTVSLPITYCHQISPFNDSDDPSPADLVEQLFKAKS